MTPRFEEAFTQYRQANELSKRYRADYDGAKLAERVGRITPVRCRLLPADPGLRLVPSCRCSSSACRARVPRSPSRFSPRTQRGARSASGEAFEQLEAAARAPAELAASLPAVARAYLERLGVHAGGALRVIDKMPANFLYAGLIHAVFPRARIIHMRRQPLDTCLSIYFQNFFNVGVYANDLKSLAHYYGEYLRICDYWRSVLPPASFLEVPYEALVEDQEGWSRRMVEFLGLPWDPRCLDFHNTERVVITASRWQVRQRLNTASIGRWRNYATHLAPLAHLAQTT